MTAGPLRQVLGAIDAGAATSHQIQASTGLSMDMIRAALQQLERMGVLTAQELATSCPAGGCGTCGSASAQTGTCATGPVLVGLSRTRLNP